jgi:hypothetical protein
MRWLLAFAAAAMACGNDRLSTGDGGDGDGAPPNGMSVQVLAPNGGQSFYQTQSVTVAWTVHSDAGGTLTCDVTADDGATTIMIASAVSVASDQTGSVTWDLATVPPSFGYKLRVSARDARNLTAADASDAPFAVTGPPRDVSFAGELQPVLSAKCTAAGCHGTIAAQEGLQLTDAATSYSNLVGVASHQCPTLQRVTPANADASYVIVKFLGSVSAPCFFGSKMPKGLTALTLEEIQAFRDWIANGAPNN